MAIIIEAAAALREVTRKLRDNGQGNPHENEKGQKAIIESEQSRTRRSKTNASHEKKKKKQWEKKEVAANIITQRREKTCL